MNTFGNSTYNFPLCDPASITDNRKRFYRECIDDLRRVNHFYSPIGIYPFRGWVLITRGEYDKLSKYSSAHHVAISNTVTLYNLSIVQARCVTRGLSGDKNALYLIELTDGRGILFNEWFQFPITTAYNIRSPAYPQTFQTDTMNGATTWTWSTMIQDMWTRMTTFLGPWPGLPSIPAGTPEGFWYVGVPAWKALCDLLSHIGMGVAHNPSSPLSPYIIVSLGPDDGAFTTLQNRYAPNLEDDLEYIDVGAGRVPSVVKVLFHRRNSIYGTEETVRYDALQWDIVPHYSVSVNAPALFSSATGTHFLWSDFTVRYDQDGVPLTDDVTTATAIAQERVTQYFDYVYSRISGFMSQTYTGALPFSTGSQIDGVCWYMDSGMRYGWKTQILRGPDPPWPEVKTC